MKKVKGERFEVGGILVIEVREALRLRLEAKRIRNVEGGRKKRSPVKVGFLLLQTGFNV